MRPEWAVVEAVDLDALVAFEGVADHLRAFLHGEERARVGVGDDGDDDPVEGPPARRG